MASGKVAIGADSARAELKWNPYQAAFLQALKQRTKKGKRAFNRFALFAGRRGGKTKIGAVAAVSEMLPGTLGWACAPTYPELQDYVIPAVLELLPRDWVADWSQSRLELTLINKARVAFRSLDDPNRARGPGLDWLWIDEARKVQELAWDVALPALTSNRGIAWFTTTPNGYDWCWRRLWKTTEEGEPGFWACRYYTSDNPAIDPEEIEAARRQLDPVFFAQEFQADFVTFTGAIYGQSIEPQILRKVDDIRRVLPEWPKVDPSRTCYVGLDPGADHPFAAVILVSTEQGLVQIGEYIARNRSTLEHKRAIVTKLSQWNPERPFWPERWAIDRSQKQMAIELAQNPLSISATAAENDVRAGINRTLAWFQTKQLWIIADECKRTVEQLRGYRWDENKNTDGSYKKEQPLKVEDDLPDALRYTLMLYPELPIALTRAERPGLEQFTDEQMWAVERSLRVNKIERGEVDPQDEDEGVAGPAEIFTEARRRYFGDDDEPQDGPLGLGDMFS